MRKWFYNFFFTTRFPLRYELAVVIFLKLTLIIFIWWISFSHPPLPPLSSEIISDHFLSTQNQDKGSP